MADLHDLNWTALGMGSPRRGDNYLTRQLERFGKLWEVDQTRDLPAVTSVETWLKTNKPHPIHTTIVHGDYRLGNTLFCKTTCSPRPKLSAVLDWEMATIGDPMADLGYLTMFWVQDGDPDIRMFELSSLTRQSGFISRAELISVYEQKAGLAAPDVEWYQVLALWKLSILMEGNYKRAISGLSDDEFLLGFGTGIQELIDVASEIAFGSTSPLK